MQSALSFAPLRPVGFVNFHGAGQGLLFAGRGGAAYFSTGHCGATIPAALAQTCQNGLLIVVLHGR